jgi:hypothetical protein
MVEIIKYNGISITSTTSTTTTTTTSIAETTPKNESLQVQIVGLFFGVSLIFGLLLFILIKIFGRFF